MRSRFVGAGWIIFTQLILYATASVVLQIHPEGYVHKWNEESVKGLNIQPQVEGRNESLLKNELDRNDKWSTVTPAVTAKPSDAPFQYLTAEDDLRKSQLVPRDETGHLIYALRLLTTNAGNFLGNLENINGRNYRSITEFLKRQAGSGLQTLDYDAMLQSWSQVATGCEELTEQFLRKMSSLASTNQTIEYKTVILLNVNIYIQAYIASVVKRQSLMMDTAFSLVNQPSLSESKFTFFEKLLNFHQQVHTHSFRTMNTYNELLNRLANIETYPTPPTTAVRTKKNTFSGVHPNAE